MKLLVAASFAISLATAAPLPQIAIGDSHGMLLKPDGTLWTWGNNQYGQRGPAAADDPGLAQFPGLSGIRAIAAGEEFSMVLDSAGRVWTWGQNQEGQLGIGTKKNSSQPNQLAGLPKVVAIAAAGNHSMALDSTGHVWAWGAVPSRTSSSVPQQVATIANVTAIAAGDHHDVALDSSGHVWVWGDHGAGDLGDNSYNLSYDPHQVRGLSNVVAIAGAYQMTLALTKDGALLAVGYGDAGQLGNGAMKTSINPVTVVGISHPKMIAATYMNGFALKSDGSVWGWGSNHYHQLGNPTFDAEYANKPVRVAKMSGIVGIAAAAGHAAAVDSRGEVWTWGQNDRGALGVEQESLQQSDVPMHPGASVAPPCQALFSCLTKNGKVIRICGEHEPNDVNKWSHLQYRYGPVSGPQELVFPADPDTAPPSLFYEKDTVRFTNGGYTYRVYLSGGVSVADSTGKIVSRLACSERPEVYIDYLRENLPKGK